MQRKESRVWSISAIFASLLPMNHLKIELGSWIDWQRDWSIDASARRSSHHLTVQLPPNYWKGTVWNQILLNNYNDAMATYKVNWVYEWTFVSATNFQCRHVPFPVDLQERLSMYHRLRWSVNRSKGCLYHVKVSSTQAQAEDISKPWFQF
jgi:hypothetical protein